MTEEIFESSVREKGGLAGVFEYDGETGYFYLYSVSDDDQLRIVDHIHILSGSTDLVATDISIKWDALGDRAALFLKGVQWAVFNSGTGKKFGGNYRSDGSPEIPPEESVHIC